MSKYSPSDILRKYVLRKCIEHLIQTSETAVWVNLTFWENVTVKSYANKCFKRLRASLVREIPNFRLVGVWARQGRGAWHIHAVCNCRLDVNWLRMVALRSGFGQQMYLRELDNDSATPERIARYITGYVTDKNALDPVKDKGVRRMIFVGPHVRVLNMRYKSSLKRVVSVGRDVALSSEADLTDFEREVSPPASRKKSYETWGEWYARNRGYWFDLGWESLSKEEREEMFMLDEFCRRYLELGRWSFI